MRRIVTHEWITTLTIILNRIGRQSPPDSMSCRRGRSAASAGGALKSCTMQTTIGKDVIETLTGVTT